jgi:acyl carrier protein
MHELNGARQLLAEAISGDVTAVPEDARIGTFERWDSLAHLRLVLAIEAQIGRQLDTEEAVRIEGLADIAALLATHAAGNRDQ